MNLFFKRCGYDLPVFIRRGFNVTYIIARGIIVIRKKLEAENCCKAIMATIIANCTTAYP